MMTIKRLFPTVNLRVWGCLFLLTVSLGVSAADDAPAATGFRLNGFGTLGLVKSNSDFDGAFRRDVSQPLDQLGWRTHLDSRLGAQVNYTFNDKLQLVAQGVLRQRPQSGSRSDVLEWAFAAYQISPDVAVRLGRTGLDLYLHADSRSVGFSFTAVRPPVDFYATLPMTWMDGIDMTKRWVAGDADWRVKGFAGSSNYYAQTSAYAMQKGDISSVLGMVLTRETDGLLIRGTVARAQLDFKSQDSTALKQGLDAVAGLPVPAVAAQAQAMNNAIKFQNIHVTYGSLGLAYDRKNWIVNAEAVRTRSDASLTALQAGYVMVGRRLGNLTVHGGISAVRSDVAPVVTPNWAGSLAPLIPVIGGSAVQQAQFLGALSAGLINSGRIEQRTVSVGLRWDFDPRMALKAQWDQVKVAPYGGLVWNGRDSGGRANVGTVTLDFLF